MTVSVNDVLSSYHGRTNPGGEKEALLSAASLLRSRLDNVRCDSEAVSDCVRCSTVYLARKVERLVSLAAAPAPSPSPLKMVVDQDWLDRRVENDPDLPCEAGAPSPDAGAGADAGGTDWRGRCEDLIAQFDHDGCTCTFSGTTCCAFAEAKHTLATEPEHPARQRNPTRSPASPSHTDLIATPESLDAYMAANPLRAALAPPDAGIVGELVACLRRNLNTMGEQRRRFIAYGKPHVELDDAIEDTEAALARVPSGGV